MTTEQILAACKLIRESGTSSKVPIPICTLEQLARDAEQWRSMPEQIREAARYVRAGQ